SSWRSSPPSARNEGRASRSAPAERSSGRRPATSPPRRLPCAPKPGRGPQNRTTSGTCWPRVADSLEVAPAGIRSLRGIVVQFAAQRHRGGCGRCDAITKTPWGCYWARGNGSVEWPRVGRGSAGTEEDPMRTRLLSLVAFAALSFVPSTSHAGHHLLRFSPLFLNPSGTVQFIPLFTSVNCQP